jgi:cell division protein FtsL
VAAWLDAIAAPAPRPRARRPAPAPRPRRAARPRILGGALWIAVVAALLAGVVSLSVVVLQLNLRYDELGRERANLRAANAALAAQLSSAASAPQVEALARKRLGLVASDPQQTVYVELGAPRP